MYYLIAQANNSLILFQEFQCPRNSVSCQSPHTQDYSDYAKEKITLNASCIGKHVVVGTYGLTLRGKVGIVIDVMNEKGCPMTVVILDDEPKVPCVFHPGDLTIEGYMFISTYLYGAETPWL